MRRQILKDDESIYEMMRETSLRGSFKYDPIEINKNMIKKNKLQQLENLENNPIIKEVIYPQLTAIADQQMDLLAP